MQLLTLSSYERVGKTTQNEATFRRFSRALDYLSRFSWESKERYYIPESLPLTVVKLPQINKKNNGIINLGGDFDRLK